MFFLPCSGIHLDGLNNTAFAINMTAVFVPHWILQRSLCYRIDFVDCVGHRETFRTWCVGHRIRYAVLCSHPVDIFDKCLIALRVFGFEAIFLSGMRFACCLQSICLIVSDSQSNLYVYWNRRKPTSSKSSKVSNRAAFFKWSRNA